MRRWLVLLTAYVALVLLGFRITFISGMAFPVWLDTGLAIAALTLWGTRLWPAIAVGAFIATCLFGALSVLVAACVAGAKALEAVLGALALRRLHVKGEVTRVRDVMAILAVAGLVPLPTATIGVLSLTLGGFLPWDSYPEVWLVWWVRDCMGALIALPLVLAWMGRSSVLKYPARPLEFAGVTGLVVVLTSFAFLNTFFLGTLERPFPPLNPFLFLPLLWGVLRLRPRENNLVMAVASGLALTFTATGSEGEIVGPLLLLQMLLISFAGGTLLLIGALAERAETEQEVRALSASLEVRVKERTATLEEKSRQLENMAAALRVSEARFSGILDIAAEAIVSVDEAQRITLFNKGAEKTFGYRAEEVLGQPLDIIMPERYREVHRRHMGEFAASNEATRLMGAHRSAIVGLRRDGTEFPVEASISKLDLGDRILLTAMLRDITERKEAEAAIEGLNRSLQQRAAELEAANRELESFSYSVSHDLRAPLRSIDGFSRMLLEAHADRLDDQGREYVERVRASCQRMAQLIDDILALSSLSRAEVHREVVDFSALAHAVAGDLQAQEPQRHVRFSIQAGISAVGDARLLRVVLENLLGNAWKYTSRHPCAHIEFGTERRDDGKTVYFIRDDGAGFDMAYAGKLFGAFQRLHTQTHFAGTGVGLTSVQRIIRRHGGEVWAESAVEAGATFRFTLGE